ncbi:MAG: ABC transporter permease [Bacilli bacterium]|nr:ABC transporter permease [Bacilli bacterium]
MFIHNFKYTLKTLLKKKSLVFWTLIFPLVLGTFFNMAFSDIEKDDKLNVFNIAIVNNDSYKNNEIYVNTFKELSNKKNKNYLFKIKYVTEEKAKELLTDKKIEGYLVFKNNKPKIVVHESGINQTILKYTVEEITSTENMIKNLTKEEVKKELQKGNYNIDYKTLNNRITEYLSNNEIRFNNLSNSNLSMIVIEFYTLIAMSCLYGGIISMTIIDDVLPNISAKGKRVAVSKTKKSVLILSGLLSGYIIQFIGTILLFLYTLFVLKIDFGDNLLLVLLITLVGNLAGLSVGIFTSTIFKTNENLKIGIIIGFSMIGSFLSGMMGMKMKYVIDTNIGFINKVNPVSMITDGLYSLYYCTGYSRYTFNIVSLLVFSLILIGISFIVLRRQKYDSI